MHVMWRGWSGIVAEVDADYESGDEECDDERGAHLVALRLVDDGGRRLESMAAVDVLTAGVGPLLLCLLDLRLTGVLREQFDDLPDHEGGAQEDHRYDLDQHGTHGPGERVGEQEQGEQQRSTDFQQFHLALPPDGISPDTQKISKFIKIYRNTKKRRTKSSFFLAFGS